MQGKYLVKDSFTVPCGKLNFHIQFMLEAYLAGPSVIVPVAPAAAVIVVVWPLGHCAASVVRAAVNRHRAFRVICYRYYAL